MNLISIGGFGKIYKLNNENIVLKRLFDDNDKEIINCKIINQMNIKNFVKFHKITSKDIYYEYFKGDTLDFLKFNINFNNILLIFKKIVNTLIQLEEKGYYHLDINLNNILVDDNNNIKIIDYSNLHHKNETINKKIGSFYYFPPEYFIENKIIIDKFEVFILGILLFELIFKFKPISNTGDYQKDCWFFCKNKLHNRKKFIKNFINNKLKNKEITNCLVKCLEFNYNQRFKLKELLQSLKTGSINSS